MTATAAAKLTHKRKSALVDLVGFYGISTIVGYLMPNPVYTYILFVNTFVDNIFKWAQAHFLHTVK